mgnify:CR=1 FL=1
MAVMNMVQDKSMLMVCAHDDDAVLYGTSLLSMGVLKRKCVLVMSTSDVLNSTLEECVDAYKCFEGVDVSFMPGHEERDMRIKANRETVLFLLEFINREAIDIVVSPSQTCTHLDHRKCATACEQACFHYRTWGNVRRSLAHWEGEILTPLQESDIKFNFNPESKTKAMSCFRNQEAFFSWSRAVLALNHFRSLQDGGDGYVECFKVASTSPF